MLFMSLGASQIGKKHQNNTLVGAETVRHSSTYIILYILFRTLIFPSLLLVLDNAAVISVLICWNENDGRVTNRKWMSVENAGYKVLLDYRRTEKIQRVYDHAIVIHRHNSQWIVRISSTNLHIRRWDNLIIATWLLQRVELYIPCRKQDLYECLFLLVNALIGSWAPSIGILPGKDMRPRKESGHSKSALTGAILCLT